MNRKSDIVSGVLRVHGLRVTAARLAVLEWLADNPHSTAEQVHEGVLERLDTLSRQAVYDVLSTCVDVALVRQFKPAGHPARFERRAEDNHHHLVCRSCGFIEDTDCHTGNAPCINPADDNGFAVDETEIVFWGLCRRCQHASQAPAETIEADGRDAQPASTETF